MAEYRFAVIVCSVPMSHEDILDATDALGEAGCKDASIRGHAEGMELLFDRTAKSLQGALASAIGRVPCPASATGTGSDREIAAAREPAPSCSRVGDSHGNRPYGAFERDMLSLDLLSSLGQVAKLRNRPEITRCRYAIIFAGLWTI